MDQIEIERKFLVGGPFKQDESGSVVMRQCYINNQGGRTVRVRIAGEKAFLTIKGPSFDGGVSRFEWEMEIPVADAEKLMLLRVSSIVEKRRHFVPFGGHTFEVDEFFGENEGLIIAEVELGSSDEAFERPDWLGEEVTGESRYYNSHLAAHPFKTWAKDDKI